MKTITIVTMFPFCHYVPLNPAHRTFTTFSVVAVIDNKCVRKLIMDGIYDDVAESAFALHNQPCIPTH